MYMRQCIMYMYMYMNPTCRLWYICKWDKLLFKVHRYSNVDVCNKNLVVRYQCTHGTMQENKEHFVLFTPIPKPWCS